MARLSRIPVAVFLAAGLLSACNSTGSLTGGSADATAPAPIVSEDETAEVVVEQPAPPPLLTYDWDTGFSAFLTPPIEVRRAAKADCMSEGYEVAVVETMVLNGSTATATYICRGDSE